MLEFRIEPMPSRRLDSEKVVYYVKERRTNQLVAKFDTENLAVENIEGWENFTPSQKLELQNYIANVRFVIDKLSLPAKYNRDYRLSLPEPLQKALTALYDKAQSKKINFDPITAMLNGLLNHIETTEKRLQAVGEPSVLPQFNIYVSQDNKSQSDRTIRKYTKKIFKSLSRVKGGLTQYADIAHKLYDKDTDLSAAIIASYVEGKTKPSKWSISCAITVLAREEVDLVSIVPLEILIQLWLIPLKFAGKVSQTEQAIKLFDTNFKLVKQVKDEAINIINNEMQRIL